MEYKIVDATSSIDLENKVNNLINQGWHLLGGVSVTGKIFADLLYAQAMVKEKE